MDRGAWRATFLGVAESDMTDRLTVPSGQTHKPKCPLVLESRRPGISAPRAEGSRHDLAK